MKNLQCCPAYSAREDRNDVLTRRVSNFYSIYQFTVYSPAILVKKVGVSDPPSVKENCITRNFKMLCTILTDTSLAFQLYL